MALASFVRFMWNPVDTVMMMRSYQLTSLSDSSTGFVWLPLCGHIPQYQTGQIRRVAIVVILTMPVGAKSPPHAQFLAMHWRRRTYDCQSSHSLQCSLGHWLLSPGFFWPQRAPPTVYLLPRPLWWLWHLTYIKTSSSYDIAQQRWRMWIIGCVGQLQHTAEQCSILKKKKEEQRR